jgi:hypothetical protein
LNHLTLSNDPKDAIDYFVNAATHVINIQKNKTNQELKREVERLT